MSSPANAQHGIETIAASAGRLMPSFYRLLAIGTVVQPHAIKTGASRPSEPGRLAESPKRISRVLERLAKCEQEIDLVRLDLRRYDMIRLVIIDIRYSESCKSA
jgi:hypothetical protein